MNNAALRTSITKIRLSSHLFHIERGRWGRKIDIKERVCVFCTVIEDEFHCFVKCPCFADIRKGLLPLTLKKFQVCIILKITLDVIEKKALIKWDFFATQY